METDSIFFSDSHKAAYMSLKYSLTEPRGIAVLTGAAGSGKTTILRYLSDELSRDEAASSKIVMVSANNMTESERPLTESLLSSYGLDPAGVNRSPSSDLLRTYLIDAFYQRKRQPYVVIDQAEGLTKDMIEEIGDLIQSTHYLEKNLQFILVGRDELKSILEAPEARQIADQIGQYFSLSALDPEETTQYIHHRFRAAEAKVRDLFDAAACTEIFQFSQGIPRAINSLCDQRMVEEMPMAKQEIAPEPVDQSAADRQSARTARDVQNKLHLAEVMDAALEPRGSDSEKPWEIASDVPEYSGPKPIPAAVENAFNPWEACYQSYQVFELARPINKQTLSGKAQAPAAQFKPEVPWSRLISLWRWVDKRLLVAALTISLGGFLGALIALYLAK